MRPQTVTDTMDVESFWVGWVKSFADQVYQEAKLASDQTNVGRRVIVIRESGPISPPDNHYIHVVLVKPSIKSLDSSYNPSKTNCVQNGSSHVMEPFSVSVVIESMDDYLERQSGIEIRVFYCVGVSVMKQLLSCWILSCI